MDARLDWITRHNIENNDEYRDLIFTGKYLAVKRPDHPMSRADGYVYIHQLQAEKKLGRRLNSGECVHHIDKDKYNNEISNLMVFKTNRDHIAFHSGCDVYLDGDVWVSEIHKNRLCPVCNLNLKDFHANMCISCYLKKKSSHIPPRDDLFKLIMKYPIVQIGRMYGVSDAAVRKWCKKYNLPFSRKDILATKLTNTSIC